VDASSLSTVLKADGLRDAEGDAEGEAILDLKVEQQTQDKTPEGNLGADPFIATEADVAKCNALSMFS
jgi:hypothetical protein